MTETYEELRDAFSADVAQGLLDETSRIERLSTLAFKALSVKADSAKDQTKRADEIATGVSDLKAKSGVQPTMIREYAKLGFLLRDVPALVSKCGGRVARKVAPLVEFNKKYGAWSINANHLERLKEWVASDNPHDAAGAMALREDCGKVAAPRAKKEKTETPAPGPLPVSEETVGAYFASRATESIVDDMIEQATPDQRVLIGEALGRHMTAECFLRMVRDFMFAHGEEPDCLLALYEIGKDLELAQVTKVAEGYIAQQGEDKSDGPANYKAFTDMVRKAAHDTFKKQPVAA